MTEITVAKKYLFPPPLQPRHAIDPVALTAAIVGGPLIVTLATFYLVVPAAALLLGGPIYVAVGTPMILIWFARRKIRASAVAVLAMCTNAALSGAALLILSVLGDPTRAGWAEVYLWMGTCFAGIWGHVTGLLYARLCRPLFQTSIR